MPDRELIPVEGMTQQGLICAPPAFIMRIAIPAFAFSLFLPLFACGSDWPHWRGPDFNGLSKEALPDNFPDALPVAWKVSVGTGFSTVSVVGGRVLTMGNTEDKDTVWCLSAESGEVMWKHTYDCELDPLYYEGGPAATPTIHEGRVYTLSKKGHAYCLDLETGKSIWSRDLVADHKFKLPEWSFSSSAFIEGERVIYNVGRGGVALSKETGKTLWMPSTETSGYATLVPLSATAHLLFSAKALISLDAKTGEPFWEIPWKSSRDVNAADPIVTDHGIVVSATAGTKLLKPGPSHSEPDVVWEQHDLKWYFNAGVVISDHIYSIHGTTHRPTELVCTDLKTGETVWAEEDFRNGAITAAGETAILFDDGELILFRATPEGYKPLLTQKLLEGKCWTVPVLANGQIYCRTAEGDLVAVKLVGRLP